MYVLLVDVRDVPSFEGLDFSASCHSLTAQGKYQLIQSFQHYISMI